MTRQPRSKWSQPALLFSLAGLVMLGIAMRAVTHIRKESEETRFRTSAQLSAIGELKATQIDQWRQERLADANAFHNPAFTTLVRHAVAGPASAEAKQTIQAWLDEFLIQGQYDQARLLDAQGHPLLAAPAGEPISPQTQLAAQAALASGKPVFQDFYFSDSDHQIHLMLFIPVLDDRKPGRGLGLLALRIDPCRTLYPFILRWPMPSNTAETLLVRQEGQEVVFLNDLRFHPGAALVLRAPLDRKGLPAAMAVRGRTGVVEGLDYRDVPVMADLRSIPGSPWFLVTRIDQAEAFASHKQGVRESLLLAGALALTTVGAAFAFWRHLRARYFRQRFAAERESAWLKDVLARSMDEIYIFTTDTLRFLFVNASACQNLGYELEELVRMTPLDIKPGFTEASFRKAIQPLFTKTEEMLIFQTVHRRKSGTDYPVEVHLQLVDRSDDSVFLAIISDITERRQAEEKLWEASQRLALHVEQSPMAVIEWDLEFKVVSWNPSAESMFGFSREEAVGQPATFLVPEAVRPFVMPVMNDLVHDRGGNRSINENLCKNGESILCDWYNTTLRNPYGQIVGVASLVLDITERSHAEAELKESERLLLESQEITRLGSYVFDLTTGFFTSSKILDEIFGIDESYTRSFESWTHLIHPEWQKIMAEYVQNEVFGKFKKFDKEYKIIRQNDRQERWVHGLGKLEFDGDKHPIRLIGTIRDITEARIIEEKLQHSEQKFRTLFETLEEGVALHEIVQDETGKVVDYRILDVNPAFQVHTGLDAASAPGRRGTEIYGLNPPPYLVEFSAVAQGGEAYAFDTFFPPMEKHFHISVISPKWGQFATVFEDITERRRREEELKQKNAEMERFTYMISHDLKSPLVTVRTFLGYLEQDLEQGKSDRAKKDMDFIRNATGKMGRLLEDLLEVSRVGRVINPPARVSLADLIQEALAAVAGAISARGVEIEVEGPPITLFGDRPRLEEIWQNLVENAVKYMGNQPSPRIVLGVEGQEPDAVFFVRDNGMGIDPKFHAKVFALFEKLDAATEGTGLGLALVKRIVELFGGQIWLESEGAGKGTCFRFTLPQALKNQKERP